MGLCVLMMREFVGKFFMNLVFWVMGFALFGKVDSGFLFLFLCVEGFWEMGRYW